MIPRRVTSGSSEVYDTFHIVLDTLEPLQVIYHEGTEKELKLIFNFEITEVNDPDSIAIAMDNLDDAANFKISILRGSKGGMTERLPMAKSEQSTLYIYTFWDVSKKGKVNFGYTLFSHRDEVSNSTAKGDTKAKKHKAKKSKHGK